MSEATCGGSLCILLQSNVPSAVTSQRTAHMRRNEDSSPAAAQAGARHRCKHGSGWAAARAALHPACDSPCLVVGAFQRSFSCEHSASR